MTQFTFSLMSDLHVDHPQPKIPYDMLHEHVIVAGDTSNGLVGLKVLNKIKNKGHQVFAVDGNHEHYANASQGRTIEETGIAFAVGLDQDLPLPTDIKVIGCNGWYPVTDEELWSRYMNDRRLCATNALEVNTLAAAQALWLRAELEQLDGKAIVVTHTAPCLDTLNPQFEGHYSNEWYWNPMMGQVMRDHADKILVWCHGHTHAAADVVVDGVRVVCCPRGYPGENPNWKPMEVTVDY